MTLKNLRYFTKLLSIVVLITLVSCEGITEKKLKSSKFQLRQLVQETEKKKYAYASYFLIAGSYSQGEEKTTTVKVFANVENRFRLIEMPIDEVRIAIDNKLKTPNIQIEYTNIEKYSDEDLVSEQWIDKVYIINCPEYFLPEKLLPIGM